MKNWAILSTFLVLLTSFGYCQKTNSSPPQSNGAAIIYSEGGAFLMEGPKGWVADHETGKQLGICCVYYPNGSTWDNAETVMYPNIAIKGPGQQTLQELMDYDLSEFRENNPTLSYEDVEDISLTHGRIAKLRYFYGVNKGSFEAVAYVNEAKMIAIVVLSSKTRKGFNQSLPLFREALQTYNYMDVKFAGSTNIQK